MEQFRCISVVINVGRAFMSAFRMYGHQTCCLFWCCYLTLCFVFTLFSILGNACNDQFAQKSKNTFSF